MEEGCKGGRGENASGDIGERAKRAGSNTCKFCCVGCGREVLTRRGGSEGVRIGELTTLGSKLAPRDMVIFSLLYFNSPLVLVLFTVLQGFSGKYAGHKTSDPLSAWKRFIMHRAKSEKNKGFEMVVMRDGNASPGSTARGVAPFAGVIHTHAYTRSDMCTSPAAYARSICSRYCVCTNNTTRLRAEPEEEPKLRVETVRLRVMRELAPARNLSMSAGESNAKDRSG